MASSWTGESVGRRSGAGAVRTLVRRGHGVAPVGGSFSKLEDSWAVTPWAEGEPCRRLFCRWCRAHAPLLLAALSPV